MTVKTLFTRSTAAALALATAMTFAITDNAEARRRGNVAAGALFGLAAGAIVGGIIAHENERRWRKRHYYYDGPGYYGYYGRPRCEVRWVRDGWGYRHRERVCW